MNRTAVCFAVVLLVTVAAATAAQQSNPDDAENVVVPLSDPTRPGRLVVEILAGDITVRATSRKDVAVRASARSDRDDERDGDEEQDEEGKSTRGGRGRSSGLHRIPNTSTGLEITEEDNTVYVETSSTSRPVDLVIEVPVRMSLKLNTVNDGDIEVEGVDGEIEVENTNGAVTLRKVSGSVVAHALNEDVIVDLVRVEPGKSMSFSSLNGDIDVTLPANLKADLRLKTDNGEIYTDFDVTMRRGSKNSSSSSSSADEEDSPKGKKKSKVYRHDNQGMYGSVNGGGPSMRFETFNGSIYIRKGK